MAAEHSTILKVGFCIWGVELCGVFRREEDGVGGGVREEDGGRKEGWREEDRGRGGG